MKNLIVEGYEAQDIQEQVDKLLRGLGHPEPPLKLEEVRKLLQVDRYFYSSDNQAAVREVVSRLIVAGADSSSPRKPGGASRLNVMS